MNRIDESICVTAHNTSKQIPQGPAPFHRSGSVKHMSVLL